jgi:hypothetical protein
VEHQQVHGDAVLVEAQRRPLDGSPQVEAGKGVLQDEPQAGGPQIGDD